MKLNRRSKQLIELFRNCQFTDLLGVGNILGVNDNQEFEDYLTNIVVKFEKLKGKKQKQLLQLVKDISEANDCMCAKRDIDCGDQIKEIKDTAESPQVVDVKFQVSDCNG